MSGAYEGGRDMVVGLKDLGVGTAKGAWNLTGGWITDPKAAKQTAQSVWSGAKGAWNVASDLAKTNPAYLLADPKGYAAAMARTQQRGANVWNAVSAPYKEATQTGHWGKALGRGVVDVGSLFLGGAGVAGKVGEGASVAGRLGRAGEALNVAARAGKFGKAGTGVVSAIDRAGALTQTVKAGTQAAKARALEQLSNLVPRPRLAMPGGLELPNMHMMETHAPGGAGRAGGAGTAALHAAESQFKGLQGTLNRMLPPNAVTGDAAKARAAAEKIMVAAEKRVAKASTAEEAAKITEQARREVARKMQSIDTRQGPLKISDQEVMYRTQQQAVQAAKQRAGIPPNAKRVDGWQVGADAKKGELAKAASGKSGRGSNYVHSSNSGGYGQYDVYKVVGADGEVSYRSNAHGRYQ